MVTDHACDVSRAVAEHVAAVTYERLPADVVEITKLSIIDGMGVILGASGLAPECLPFMRAACGGRPEATILGTHECTDAAAAAFANGAMSHALDFEDAHVRAPVHANAAALPAALALAEAAHAGGRDLITAVAVGCDLASRLGLAAGAAMAQRGWYPPPILSAQGAAAAAGQLLGLSIEALLDAMSITACQIAPSFEIVHGERSVLRSVREAFCARTAVVAAQLAHAGLAGGPRPLDGDHGVLTMFAGADWEEGLVLDDLGERFEGLSTSFKLWPSCRGTHAFIEGALRLVQGEGIAPTSLERVCIEGGPVARMLIEPIERKRAPKTAIDAKFSIPFTVATALHRGVVDLESFEPERLADPEILALAARIECTVNPQRPDNSALVEIVDRSAKEYRVEVQDVPGDPGRPLAVAELERKFLDCASRARTAVDDRALATFLAAARELEQVDDVAELVSVIRPAPPASEV